MSIAGAVVAAVLLSTGASGVPPEPHVRAYPIEPGTVGSPALSHVADRIAALGEGRGFANQMVDEQLLSIRVWWVGEVPQDVVDYASQNPEGVTVEFETTAIYSKDELVEAGMRLLNDPIASELGIFGASGRIDGLGLELHVSDESSVEAVKRQVPELSRIAGAPVVGVAVSGPPMLAATAAG